MILKNNWFFELIKNRRLLFCVLIGFSSGLPFYTITNLFSIWFRSFGIDLKTIGLFALIQLPYTWKFFWSPFCDKYNFFDLGRRRSWMLLTQVALLLIIPVFGWLSPKSNLSVIITLSIVLAFLSATQDIVIDGFRRELLQEPEQGLGNVVHVNAYKFSSLVPGSLSLILADYVSWILVFTITGMFMLPGIVLTLFMKEPFYSNNIPKTLKEAVIQPFQEFLSRQGIINTLAILVFIFLYKLGDTMATSLLTPFYLDLGFSKTEIGLIAKNAGLWTSIFGGIMGGIALVQLGVNRSLWIFGVLQSIVILAFVWLTMYPPDLIDLAIVIALESFGMSLGTAAFTAFIAIKTNPNYAATQFALFTSLAATPRVIANSFAGYFIEGGDISFFNITLFHINALGWQFFYLLCFFLTIPGLLLLIKIAPWNQFGNINEFKI